MSDGIDVRTLQKRLRDVELALNESSIVAITDTQGNIQFANRKFCEISKYDFDELIGSNQRIVNSGHHSRAFMKNMWKTIGTGNVWRGEIKNKAKDGSFYWVDTTIVPFLKDNGKPYQYISIRHEITKRIEYEEQMRQMAYYDPLTSLPNRNFLDKWIKERPHQPGSFAVLFIDLDRFKAINDNFGHYTGDLLLAEVARRLQNTLRKTDFISRQGGDEFIIILDSVYSKQAIKAVLDKIIKEITLPYMIKNEQLVITASIGISMNESDASDGEAANMERHLQQADTAMYNAKRQGGNVYCFNTPSQNQEMERYYNLEQEIKSALSDQQFSIVYQPLINLKNNTISGAEALLRWNNPKLGSVSPMEFIPILEEFRHIIQVGNWVLRTVCEQMKQWQDNGVYLQKVSVNVSPVQFRAPGFVHNIQTILKETELDANYLELEITEGTLFNIEKSARTLHLLKEAGVRVSIDDFGTGYSSLSYLKQLPINTLKIDKSFIDDLDADGEIIIDTIINMGKNLNFTVIAEGIENREQLAYLQRQNCHEGQGYYFSKPVSATEITKLYAYNSKVKREKVRNSQTSASL